MKRRIRIYVVDEDDRIHRIRRSYYRRILRGQEAIYLYAGKPVRFAARVVGVNKKGLTIFAIGFFPLVHFASDGRINREKRARELAMARQVFAMRDEEGWGILYEAEREAEFRWRPTRAVLHQLQDLQGDPR